ncbi:MAG TPA: NifU family protein [Ktedonobacteraceae bacterium]|jgi:Fe-S cluster biogenesis protein NfuA|nr:NifU family protein [Ktedonobacteraceae bacterium]
MQQDLQEHQRRAERIETLLQDVASFPDGQMRSVTEELVQLLLDLYGDGLARMLELIMAYAPDASPTASSNVLLESLTHDEVISSLLVLHGLHPLDLKARVSRVLQEMQPYLTSHGGSVELVSLENNNASLRFAGNCHGCSSSSNELKTLLEKTLYKAVPDLENIQIEDASKQTQGVPVTFVAPQRRNKEKEHGHARVSS